MNHGFNHFVRRQGCAGIIKMGAFRCSPGLTPEFLNFLFIKCFDLHGNFLYKVNDKINRKTDAELLILSITDYICNRQQLLSSMISYMCGSPPVWKIR